MNVKPLLWSIFLGGALFMLGCGPTGGRYGYGSGYNPSRAYDSYYGDAYGGSYDPYDTTRQPYAYGTYDNRSPWEARRDFERAHENEHENLEHKYDKAMRRLDRQEREAEENLRRKYGANTNNPEYLEKQQKIDQKYDYKRGKVERNTRKEHDEYHNGW